MWRPWVGKTLQMKNVALLWWSGALDINELSASHKSSEDMVGIKHAMVVKKYMCLTTISIKM